MTGRHFQDGEKIVSVLRETPKEWVRLDYSLEGWSHAQHTPEEVASRWHSIFRAKAPAPELVAKNDVESLLRRLIHIGSAEDIPTRYVLAVMLERKKVLKPVDTIERSGRRIIVYEHAKTGESILVEDPRLKLSEIEPIQNRVRQLLDNPSLVDPRPLSVGQVAESSGWTLFLRRTTPTGGASSSVVPALGLVFRKTRSFLRSTPHTRLRRTWNFPGNWHPPCRFDTDSEQITVSRNE